jgi:hypothetical protein
MRRNCLCTYYVYEVQRLAKKGFELAMTRTKKNYVVLTKLMY